MKRRKEAADVSRYAKKKNEKETRKSRFQRLFFWRRRKGEKWLIWKTVLILLLFFLSWEREGKREERESGKCGGEFQQLSLDDGPFLLLHSSLTTVKSQRKERKKSSIKSHLVSLLSPCHVRCGLWMFQKSWWLDGGDSHFLFVFLPFSFWLPHEIKNKKDEASSSSSSPPSFLFLSSNNHPKRRDEDEEKATNCFFSFASSLYLSIGRQPRDGYGRNEIVTGDQVTDWAKKRKEKLQQKTGRLSFFASFCFFSFLPKRGEKERKEGRPCLVLASSRHLYHH